MAEPRKFTVTNMADFDHEADIQKQRLNFPGSQYGDPRTLVSGLDAVFEKALLGSEEDIQRVITANPYLLNYVTPNTGHHGTWVFPKRMIRTKRTDGTPGLIPDYLVASRNSLGFTWHIVELKLAKVQFANRKGTSFTRDAAEGIAQCAKYQAHFNDYIETIRSNIGVQEVITPKSVILLIGDGQTESDVEQECRREFSILCPNLIVASYDRIRRGLSNDLRHRNDLS